MCIRHLSPRHIAALGVIALFAGGAVAQASDTDATYTARGSTVGSGLGTAPQIDAAIQAAAGRAGCTTRSFPAEANGVAYANVNGNLHSPGALTWSLSSVPTNGLHFPVWADYGFYNQPVPYGYQVHDLEHGAVVIHYGAKVTGPRLTALRQFWADHAAFILVVPDRSPSFPKNAVVATSWQRWISCKPFAPAKSLPAIKAFRDAYRGTGPEGASAINANATAPGLPQPLAPDLTSALLGRG